MQEAPLPLQNVTRIPLKNNPVLQISTEPSGPSPRIKAADFKALDQPERTACAVCGRAWSDYAERKKPGGDPPRRICRTCYLGMKRRAQKSARILPGTFDVSRAERVTASIGRCTICNLDRAAYLDRATGTSLCEYCYQRAMQAQGNGEVSG